MAKVVATSCRMVAIVAGMRRWWTMSYVEHTRDATMTRCKYMTRQNLKKLGC